MVSSAADTALVQFNVLGPISVTLDGQAVMLGGPRQVAVLARLLLAPSQVVSMDQLIDAIWDGDEPARPDTAIRSYISNLRRAIEPERQSRDDQSCLVSVPPGYRLVVDRNQIDWVRYDRAVTEAQRLVTNRCHEQALEQLGTADSLWQGEPLGGVPDSDIFTAHRSRLNELRAVSVEVRCEAELGLNLHRHVGAVIEAAIAEQPYRERLTELGMIALYRSGRQSDALALGASLRQRLVDELGIDPGPAIAATEQQILNHDPVLLHEADSHEPVLDLGSMFDTPTDRHPASHDRPAGAGARPPAGRAVPQPRPVPGREPEMAVLDEVAGHHRRGHGTLTTIVGDYGMGKSELAHYLTTALQADGAAAGWWRGSSGGLSDADPRHWNLRAWAYALADLFLHIPPDLLNAASARIDLRSLGWLGPAVAAPLGLDGPPSMPADTQATGLAIVRLLSDLTRSMPLVVVLDGLEQADATSIEVAEFVANSLASFPVALVCTWQVPVGSHGDNEAALGRLARVSGNRRLDLGPLRVESLHELNRWFPAPLPAGRLHEVHRRSGGNLLFARELVAELARELEASGGSAAASRSAASPLVESVAGYLAPLDTETVSLLTAGALYRLPFTGRELAAVYPDEPGGIEERLQAASRRGVLIEPSSGPGNDGEGYRFRHPIVAEVLAGQLSARDRADRHQSIGRLLVSQGADSVEIAYHLSLSPEVADHLLALSLVLDAVDSEPAGVTWSDVDRIVRRGLDTANDAPDALDLLARGYLYLSWRSRLIGAGDAWRTWAGSALQAALDHAGRLSPVPSSALNLVAAAALNAVGRCPYPLPPGTVHLDPVMAESLIPALNQAASLLGDHAEALRCRLELLPLTAVHSSSDVEPIWDKLAKDGRKLVSSGARRSSLGTVELALGCLDWFSPHLGDRERRDVLEQTTRSQVQLGEALAIERHWHLELVRRGLPGEALSRIHPMVRMADHSGDCFDRIAARSLMVRHLLWVGNTVDARRSLSELLGMIQHQGFAVGDAVIEQTFELRRLEGRGSELTISQDWIDKPWNSPLARSARSALMFAAVGRAAAGRWLGQAVEELEWDRRSDALNAGVLCWMAEAAFMIGGEIGALAADAVVGRLGALGDRVCESPARVVLIGPASHYHGLAAAAGGDHEAAVDILASAAAVSERLEAGPALHRSLRAMGYCLQQLGRQEEAVAAHDEASAVAQRLDSGLNRAKQLEAVAPTVTTDLWLRSN